MAAAVVGAIPAVRCLAKAGADADAKASDGRYALIMAAETAPADKAEELTRALLECGASPEGPALADGEAPKRVPTPLIAAACACRPKVAAVLLAARADASAADNTGRRPLTCSAASGGLELCRQLLQNRANVNDRGTSGAGAATRVGQATSVGGVTALSMACANGNIDLVKLLLSENADPALLDERGRTALMASAQAGSVSVCKELLAAKVDTNLQQPDGGKTALIFAAGADKTDVCKLLLDARAAVDVQADTGASALHAAAANGHEATCKCLVAGGAVASQPGPGGKDAAALAASAGHTTLSEMLKNGAATGTTSEAAAAA